MAKCLHKRNANEVYLKQIVRSGSSIGANVSEGSYAQSTPDYITKHTIALKEANETKYWLTLLHEDKTMTDIEFNSMMSDLIEIIKILTKLIKTAKGIR